jgi:ADP-heptose:LPS heptosyltransferase
MASRAHSRHVVIALATARMLADAVRSGRRVAPASPKRILIAHHLLLGDTIMLTPLIAKCRARWPDADIAMICPVPYAGLYAAQPFGVCAMPYDPRDASTVKALRAERGFDLALVPADNRLSWLARALDARWIVAFAGDSPPYKDWPVDELRSYPDEPAAWGDLAAGLIDGPPPAPFRAGDWNAPPAAEFALPEGRFCVLHVGASTPLKQWPADRWRALGQRLAAQGFAIALSAGPGEAALLDAIGPDPAWTRYPGLLSLPQLWRLLARAALLVCPDTGIAHLARLAGVPTVALFGPGSALLSGAGDFWRDSPFTALTIPDFPCRDQRITMKREVSWIRRCERFPGNAASQCPQPRCMLALTDDVVWQACVDRLRISGA